VLVLLHMGMQVQEQLELEPHRMEMQQVHQPVVTVAATMASPVEQLEGLGKLLGEHRIHLLEEVGHLHILHPEQVGVEHLHTKPLELEQEEEELLHKMHLELELVPQPVQDLELEEP